MYTEHKNEWYSLWIDDKESILDTMIRNMQADIRVGYDPHGNTIIREKAMIEAYRNEYHNTLDIINRLDHAAMDRWCYNDLKRRGAIA